MAIRCVKYLCKLGDGRNRVVFTDGKTTNLARLIGAITIRRPLDEKEVAHHRNGDCSDDSLGNIQVLSRGDHSRWHSTKPHPPRIRAASAREVAVTVRVPDDLMNQLRQLAADNFRSINSEMVYRLRRSFDAYRK